MDSRFKNSQNFHSNQLMTQKTFQNLDSNQLVTLWCYSFPVSYDLFWLSTLLLAWYDLLWAFHSCVDFVWHFLGFRHKRLPRQTNLSYLRTQAVSRRLESIQFMTQVAFHELTQNQLMTQVHSQILIQIDLWLKIFPDFSIKSTHDSNENHLILSRLMIRLSVMLMSGQRRAVRRMFSESLCTHDIDRYCWVVGWGAEKQVGISDRRLKSRLGCRTGS